SARAREFERARNAGFDRLLVVTELTVWKNLDVDASGHELFESFLEFNCSDVTGMNFVRGVREPHANYLLLRAHNVRHCDGRCCCSRKGKQMASCWFQGPHCDFLPFAFALAYRSASQDRYRDIEPLMVKHRFCRALQQGPRALPAAGSLGPTKTRRCW